MSEPSNKNVHNQGSDQEAHDYAPPSTSGSQENDDSRHLPEALKNQPPEAVNEILEYFSEQLTERIGLEVSQTSFFAGPLPPPQLLEGYERLYPGASQLLFEQFRSEAEHRRHQENRIITHDTVQTYLGQVFGFLIVLAAIVLAGLAVYADYEIAAVIIGIAALSTLAGAFIARSRIARGSDSEDRGSSSG